MPLKLALGVRETVAGHRLGALEGGGGRVHSPPPPLPTHPCPPRPPPSFTHLPSSALRKRTSSCTASVKQSAGSAVPCTPPQKVCLPHCRTASSLGRRGSAPASGAGAAGRWGGGWRTRARGEGAPLPWQRRHEAHMPQRPAERSDPTQHTERRTGDCPRPRKETATRRRGAELH